MKEHSSQYLRPFRDLMVSLLLRRKGLQTPNLVAGHAPIAPWGRPRWGTACPRPCEETPRPEAQHLARPVLACINVVRQEQCARGRGIKQGTRVGLPRHGINAPFLLELGCSGTRARAVEVSEVSDE